MSTFSEMSRDELLRVVEMFAKNWLAHDGCWFLAAEERLGLEAAIELDERSWARFAGAEARRVLAFLGREPGGGLEALDAALSLRMYAAVNEQHSEWSDDRARLRFVMDSCRVQATRRRKGLPDFPCKSVGIVEFSTFARTVDPRIRAECVHCPPDAPDGAFCAWDFRIEERGDGGSHS